ncbi:hypothetical protein PGTUg99_020181 [Puccinia graminis f. sp. tritici]|uniref:Uncharacterized protein n=1 Tax=Puccinia graminis f. sp. tritici TaxID=56615 RepID=A0A5B0SC30_PUCGR|nr:hypothetical protein PGTUg99_020181 [Puccinia graminis f. sp. tritici]
MPLSYPSYDGAHQSPYLMTPTGDDPASRHEMSSVPVGLHSDEADSPVRSHRLRHVRQASAAITRKGVWPTCAARLASPIFAD